MQDMILILNYSDEFALEAAKRLRAEQVYCKIVAGMTTATQIREMEPRGILLTGEAASGAGVFDAGILELGIPVLALGHAAHMLLAAQGGASADVSLKEKKAAIHYGESPLFAGLDEGERYIQEALTLMLPPDVQMSASAASCTIAFEKPEKKQYGIQFELERNDPEGSTILKNFALDICGCTRWWSIEAAMDAAESALKAAADKGGSAVCAVSGGVDSTVAAALTHRAFGDRMTAIFVDTGLMRMDEGESIAKRYEAMGIPLLRVDRSGVVLEALAHKTSMSDKHSVVARCLHEEVVRQSASMPNATTLVLGNNYSDYLQGGSRSAGWEDCALEVIEPLETLFKSDVRGIAQVLGLDETIVERKPFPALGLGARIIGEVTQDRLHMLRMADAIFSEEIELAGLGRKLHKYFPVLASAAPLIGSETIILRAVTRSGGQLLPARLPYDLIERTVQRIRRQTPQTVRVFFDYTPTPVGQESFA